MRTTRLFALSAIALIAGPVSAGLRTGGPVRSNVCTLYEHRDFQGAALKLADGDGVSFASASIGSTEWRERPDWNDVVSSARIAPRCHLVAYEHMQGGGDQRTWNGGPNGLRVMYVGGEWNDRISSAKCYCS